jgi:hypothetical protein
MAGSTAEGAALQISSPQQFSDLIYKKQKATFVQFYSRNDEKSNTFATAANKLAAKIDGITLNELLSNYNFDNFLNLISMEQYRSSGLCCLRLGIECGTVQRTRYKCTSYF